MYMYILYIFYHACCFYKRKVPKSFTICYQCSGNTHTSDSYVGDRTMKNYHEAAEFVKKCLGGTEDDALLFCGSRTTTSIKRLHEVLGIGQEGGKIVNNRTADIIQETRKLNLKKKGGIPETQSTVSNIGSCKKFQQMHT